MYWRAGRVKRPSRAAMRLICWPMRDLCATGNDRADAVECELIGYNLPRRASALARRKSRRRKQNIGVRNVESSKRLSHGQKQIAAGWAIVVNDVLYDLDGSFSRRGAYAENITHAD